MTHPEDLLTGHVDGTLSPQDRAALDAHLDSCERCRQELVLASRSRAALAALPEAAAPPGVAQRAIDASRLGRTTSSVVPPVVARRRLEIMALAAAAAVVALLVAVLPHLGGAGTAELSRQAPGAQGAVGSALPPTVPGRLSLEIQQVDYDPTSLGRLAASYSSNVSNASPGSAAPRPTGAGTQTFAGQEETAAAASCLEGAFPGFGGQPIRLIRATFRGRPAYLGFYVEGPGAGLPSDELTIRVASIESCASLSFASAKL